MSNPQLPPVRKMYPKDPLNPDQRASIIHVAMTMTAVVLVTAIIGFTAIYIWG